MSTRGNWILMVATLVAAAWGFAGCAHGGSAPAEQPETVGALAPSYHSVAVQPVHESTPPPSFEIAGSADDDDAAPVVTAADAGPDAAPDVVAKGAGLQLGGSR